MIAAVFYRQADDGVWHGRCDTIPAWPGVTAGTFEECARKARVDLPAYVAEHFTVVHYRMTGAAA